MSDKTHNCPRWFPEGHVPEITDDNGRWRMVIRSTHPVPTIDVRISVAIDFCPFCGAELEPRNWMWGTSMLNELERQMLAALQHAHAALVCIRDNKTDQSGAVGFEVINQVESSISVALKQQAKRRKIADARREWPVTKKDIDAMGPLPTSVGTPLWRKEIEKLLARAKNKRAGYIKAVEAWNQDPGDGVMIYDWFIERLTQILEEQ